MIPAFTRDLERGSTVGASRNPRTRAVRTATATRPSTTVSGTPPATRSSSPSPPPPAMGHRWRSPTPCGAARPVPHWDLLLPFTLSIGAAHTTDLPGHGYSALLHAADVPMYRVKTGAKAFPYLGTADEVTLASVNGCRPGLPWWTGATRATSASTPRTENPPRCAPTSGNHRTRSAPKRGTPNTPARPGSSQTRPGASAKHPRLPPADLPLLRLGRIRSVSRTGTLRHLANEADPRIPFPYRATPRRAGRNPSCSPTSTAPATAATSPPASTRPPPVRRVDWHPTA